MVSWSKRQAMISVEFAWKLRGRALQSIGSIHPSDSGAGMSSKPPTSRRHLEEKHHFPSSYASDETPKAADPHLAYCLQDEHSNRL